MKTNIERIENVPHFVTDGQPGLAARQKPLSVLDLSQSLSKNREAACTQAAC